MLYTTRYMGNFTQYNGWNNYATWRIWNDMLVNIDFTERVVEEYLEEIVNDIVFTNKTVGGYIEDYANLFIAEVDFEELMDAINDNVEAQTKYE